MISRTSTRIYSYAPLVGRLLHLGLQHRADALALGERLVKRDAAEDRADRRACQVVDADQVVRVGEQREANIDTWLKIVAFTMTATLSLVITCWRSPVRGVSRTSTIFINSMKGMMMVNPGFLMSLNSPKRVTTPTNPCWTTWSALKIAADDEDDDDARHDC